MKKVAIILCLVLLVCCLSSAAEELDLGELTKGYNLDSLEEALLSMIGSEISDTNVVDSGNEAQPEESLTGWLLYEDDNISVSFSDLRVEDFFGSPFLKTELLFVNKTDEIIHFVCDTIIVNGCAVDISKFVDIPGMSKYLNGWDNKADLYLKYGITEVETFSMVFDYRGENIDRVESTRTDTIRIK